VDQVFLARHGETEWNREGRRQGQLDSPLTIVGLAKTRRIAVSIADLPVDSVFSSPLGRAAATAQLFAESLEVTPIVIDELREVDHGEMAGLTNAEIEQSYPGELDRRAADHYRWRFPSGESYEDADRRAAVALQKVEATGVLRPLLVSHEMIGRMLLRNLLELDPAEALKTRQPHDIVYRIDVLNRALEVLHLNSA
jgi:broad specificity phosphatase PhoE